MVSYPISFFYHMDPADRLTRWCNPFFFHHQSPCWAHIPNSQPNKTIYIYIHIDWSWFGTFSIFHLIYWIILPIDELIFFKMVKTTNHIYIYIYTYMYIEITIRFQPSFHHRFDFDSHHSTISQHEYIYIYIYIHIMTKECVHLQVTNN